MASGLISVVLPVHNQHDHIGRIVEEYTAELARMPVAHEMLLVANGCRDDSLAVCHELADRYTSVRALECESAGWGRAVTAGLAAARGDLLCYTNSARTSAQDLLLVLLYAVAFPDAVIKANRKIRESWRRRAGSLLYNLECRALFDLSYWDINGTPKVFPRRFDKLMALSEPGDLIDAEFSAVCRREDYPMLEVPIFSSRRHGGRSTTGYRSALRMYWGVYRLWRSGRP
ncbi:MAG TPA: glycosyltransferase [Candidatus Dormibacteraeota bacterium]|nr:glycosyltransferase [Candidatus Dormibacteraeota bacterium]